MKVAIIGRANVGKSTLFNRLIERKKAIVSNIPGTTRDRNYGQLDWRGLKFYLIDTGGLDLVHDPAFEKDVIKQAMFALKEANLVLLTCDVKAGLLLQDKNAAALLRKSNKPVIVVLNKADTLALKKQTTEFYRLGLGEPIPVSAINGTGTGDLLDKIVEGLKKSAPEAHQPLAEKKENQPADQPPAIKIAIIGKPNVGKSSLVNAILGEERMITSPVPYTTRDAQDIDLSYQNQNYTLIDTAGLRKKGKVRDALEKFSVASAEYSIKKADLILLITDVSLPLAKQDKILADLILEQKKSLVMIANKWDLIEQKDPQTIEKFIDYYHRFFPFLNFAPIIFVSALEKQRVKKVLEVAKEIYVERFRQITENALDKFLKKLLKQHAPPKGKGTRKPKIYGLKQDGTNPPQFELVKDYQSDLHDSYLKFIENKLREKFGFLGAPIIIRVRKLTR